MKRRVSVKRRTRRRQQKRTRRHRQQGGGDQSSVKMPIGSIVIERDSHDKYSPFLAVERDTARNELSASSE